MKKATLFIAILIFPLGNIFSQCFPDRHNSTWFDGWISCAEATSPNSARGNSHWILYNLNHTYQLGQMHVWNTNAEDYLADGAKDVVIDVSMDGVNWIEVGQYQFQMADGSSTYEGFAGPDFEGIEARYLLITAQSNWGGLCYGFSEIRVDVLGVVDHTQEVILNNCFAVNIFPNPVTSHSKAEIITRCTNDLIEYTIQDITGQILRVGSIEPLSGKAVLDLNFTELAAGSYILNLQQNGISVKEKIIKME